MDFEAADCQVFSLAVTPLKHVHETQHKAASIWLPSLPPCWTKLEFADQQSLGAAAQDWYGVVWAYAMHGRSGSRHVSWNLTELRARAKEEGSMAVRVEMAWQHQQNSPSWRCPNAAVARLTNPGCPARSISADVDLACLSALECSSSVHQIRRLPGSTSGSSMLAAEA